MSTNLTIGHKINLTEFLCKEFVFPDEVVADASYSSGNSSDTLKTNRCKEHSFMATAQVYQEQPKLLGWMQRRGTHPVMCTHLYQCILFLHFKFCCFFKLILVICISVSHCACLHLLL